MTNKIDWPPPTTILAIAVLAGVVGVSLYFLRKAIGIAIGLAISVSATGLATAGAVGSWAAPAAGAGVVAAVGVSSALVVIKRISDSAREKPYDWGLPLLGAFAGFSSTLAKDVGLSNSVSKWLFGGITAMLIVAAGACYKRPGVGWKSVAVVLYLFRPWYSQGGQPLQANK